MDLITKLRSTENAVSCGELAKLLGVAPNTLSGWATKGTVPAFKVGADYRFDPKQIADYIEAQQNSYRRALHECGETLCKQRAGEESK